MIRLFAFASLMICVAVGCGRSKDNAAGFDRAIQDIQGGVAPAKQPPSSEYQQGYKEVIDAVDSAAKRQQEHSGDQERARQLHEQVLRNKK